jgi:tRNA U34 5-methylaminomethyl-2-thiouridine-forming methyltransferase MnmC
MSLPKLTSSDLEIIPTDDSSKTLFHKALGVHYRSTQGADTESNLVFINGSLITEQKNWTVVELGFGGAVNFQNLVASQQDQSIHYIAIDHQPIPPELLEGNSLATQMAREALLQVRSKQTVTIITENNICLELHPFSYQKTNVPKNWAKAFFHDPFCPKTNPQCWTEDCFQFAYRCLHKDGILTTYGAAGHARRAMAAVGFKVASSKGPGKKREITFAAKNINCLQHATVLSKYKSRLS